MAPVARSSLFDLADQNLSGELESLLREWRTDGLTFADIAHQLRTEHEITVTHETVRAWCVKLGIHTATPETAS
jgi:hypothetical protein